MTRTALPSSPDHGTDHRTIVTRRWWQPWYHRHPTMVRTMAPSSRDDGPVVRGPPRWAATGPFTRPFRPGAVTQPFRLAAARSAWPELGSRSCAQLRGRFGPWQLRGRFGSASCAAIPGRPAAGALSRRRRRVRGVSAVAPGRAAAARPGRRGRRHHPGVRWLTGTPVSRWAGAGRRGRRLRADRTATASGRPRSRGAYAVRTVRTVRTVRAAVRGRCGLRRACAAAASGGHGLVRGARRHPRVAGRGATCSDADPASTTPPAHDTAPLEARTMRCATSRWHPARNELRARSGTARLVCRRQQRAADSQQRTPAADCAADCAADLPAEWAADLRGGLCGGLPAERTGRVGRR